MFKNSGSELCVPETAHTMNSWIIPYWNEYPENRIQETGHINRIQGTGHRIRDTE
jgi:hypothetical protein